MTVPDGTTIAITGLIREDTVTRINKVPLLGDIPFLGALFRRKVNSVERTNLLIFVTPKIVTDMKDALEAKRAWEAKANVTDSATNVSVNTTFEQ